MATYYYVNVPDQTTVNLRDSAGGNVIARVPHGTRCLFHLTLSDYKKVTPDGYPIGYIMTKYLSSTQPSGGGSSPWASRYGTTTWSRTTHGGTYYAEVANIQRDLYKIGYTSIKDADGRYGTITETAVKNFQKNNGLKDDGLFGSNSKTALWEHPDR